MRGIKIDFLESGAKLNLNAEVTGYDAVNQDTLVNIGTQLRSDASDSNRGCSLESLTLKSSAIISLQSAQHAVNIAAVETTDYIIANEDKNETETLFDLTLEPTIYRAQGLNINAVTLSNLGNTRGTRTTLI